MSEGNDGHNGPVSKRLASLRKKIGTFGPPGPPPFMRFKLVNDTDKSSPPLPINNAGFRIYDDSPSPVQVYPVPTATEPHPMAQFPRSIAPGDEDYIDVPVAPAVFAFYMETNLSLGGFQRKRHVCGHEDPNNGNAPIAIKNYDFHVTALGTNGTTYHGWSHFEHDETTYDEPPISFPP